MAEVSVKPAILITPTSTSSAKKKAKPSNRVHVERHLLPEVPTACSGGAGERPLDVGRHGGTGQPPDRGPKLDLDHFARPRFGFPSCIDDKDQAVNRLPLVDTDKTQLVVRDVEWPKRAPERDPLAVARRGLPPTIPAKTQNVESSPWPKLGDSWLTLLEAQRAIKSDAISTSRVETSPGHHYGSRVAVPGPG